MSGADGAHGQQEAAEAEAPPAAAAVVATAAAAAAAQSLARSRGSNINQLPDELLGRILELAARPELLWWCVLGVCWCHGILDQRHAFRQDCTAHCRGCRECRACVKQL